MILDADGVRPLDVVFIGHGATANACLLLFQYSRALMLTEPFLYRAFLVEDYRLIYYFIMRAALPAI